MKKDQQFRKRIKQGQSFLLLTHQEPDGDALGSLILLNNLIKALNPQAKTQIVIDKNFKPALSYFVKKYKLGFEISSRSFDTVITVDVSNLERIVPTTKSIDINIDHHFDNNIRGKLNIVDHKQASTGQIIYNLCQEFKIPLNKHMAEALYLAIYTDTGSFSFANTNAEAFQAATAAVEAGANPYQMYHELHENYSFAELKEFGQALGSAATYCQGKLILGTISKDSKLDNRFLIDFLRKEKNCVIAAVLTEKTDMIKISLRSKGPVDVSAIARKFNGGGHKLAAAGKISGVSLDQAKAKLVEYFQDHVF